MAGQYTYDTTGQSYFFALTVLLLGLIPFTYTTLFNSVDRKLSKAPAPCPGWNRKSLEVRNVKGRQSLVSPRLAKPYFLRLLLAVGWVAFAVVVQRASRIEGEAAQFDPFTILGVSTSATEKQIKKHYKRLSLKFHPDKLVLAANQTKEDADNHFVELTKAYKALTDEVSRTNYEMYGHPDGKQEFSQGIALPAWVVESQNTWWVMGAYALVLGVALPFLVGRWWYGTRKLTKDGVLNSTASKYFHALKEETTFAQLLDILASSDEFATDPQLVKLRKSVGKTGIDEYARLNSTVREGPDGKFGWEVYSTWTPAQKRARVFVAAHMLRLPIKDSKLLKEKHATASIALPLCSGLASIALAHNWLSTYISIMHLQQFLLQAVHPSSSQLLQLPHVSPELVAQAQAQGVATVKEFGRLANEEVHKLMDGYSEGDKKEVVEVAKHWPVVDFVDAKFQVTGEKIVTPGAVVSFSLKLRLTPPGKTPTKPEILDITKSNAGGVDIEGEEQSIAELIGRRNEKEDGVVPTPLAHAPHFVKNRKPAWYIFVGDHKLNRVFVAPHKFTDMGDSAIRTVRMTFQAPPGAGLYTFQVYVMSDSFVGTDAQKDMR
ncbi:protein-transporting protein SEC63, partial [Sporobolomyces koalae]|uniref:protein-transporting protein SEC63 n=1 Tax=Sporobolomyces koalae TaxID=500713 RepID=UPI003172F8D0